MYIDQKPGSHLKNSVCQKSDTMEGPYWGSTNVRCHHTKFSPNSDRHLGCVQLHV